MGKLSDKELLDLLYNPQTAKQGFNLLVRQFQEKIYWHIRRIVICHEDANDVVQETFINAWKNLNGFRGDAKLFTWLYRIATNEAITLLNKRKKYFFQNLDDVQIQLSEKIDESYFDGDKAELTLQKAILMLPNKQRIVFNMRYYDEVKFEDMAKILNTSEGALKASYHHAKDKIEKFLKNN